MSENTVDHNKAQLSLNENNNNNNQRSDFLDLSSLQTQQPSVAAISTTSVSTSSSVSTSTSAATSAAVSSAPLAFDFVNSDSGASASAVKSGAIVNDEKERGYILNRADPSGMSLAPADWPILACPHCTLLVAYQQGNKTVVCPACSRTCNIPGAEAVRPANQTLVQQQQPQQQTIPSQAQYPPASPSSVSAYHQANFNASLYPQLNAQAAVSNPMQASPIPASPPLQLICYRCHQLLLYFPQHIVIQCPRCNTQMATPSFQRQNTPLYANLHSYPQTQSTMSNAPHIYPAHANANNRQLHYANSQQQCQPRANLALSTAQPLQAQTQRMQATHGDFSSIGSDPNEASSSRSPQQSSSSLSQSGFFSSLTSRLQNMNILSSQSQPTTRTRLDASSANRSSDASYQPLLEK